MWFRSLYWLHWLGKVVTRDASASVGAAVACQDNVRNSWPAIFNGGATQVRGLVLSLHIPRRLAVLGQALT
jgi:hypothetical protein